MTNLADAGAAGGTDTTRRLVCIEIGGSSVQTVILDGDSAEYHAGTRVVPGASVAISVPGHVRSSGVVDAANLGWTAADPAAALGLAQRPSLVLNDASAAALGEWVLRDGVAHRLLFVCIGTGIGGAVVDGGRVVASNLLGHDGDYAEATCTCGRVGCLETVAAGWALPTPLDRNDQERVAETVATAIRNEPVADGATIVVAGGLAERYPRVVNRLADHLDGRTVERSARPAGFKSASAWGLRWALSQAGQSR